jgi:hypothetical protein
VLQSASWASPSMLLRLPHTNTDVKQAAEKLAIGQKDVLSGAKKPDVFSIVYGPTKVVP